MITFQNSFNHWSNPQLFYSRHFKNIQHADLESILMRPDHTKLILFQHLCNRAGSLYFHYQIQGMPEISLHFSDANTTSFKIANFFTRQVSAHRMILKRDFEGARKLIEENIEALENWRKSLGSFDLLYIHSHRLIAATLNAQEKKVESQVHIERILLNLFQGKVPYKQERLNDFNFVVVYVHSIYQYLEFWIRQRLLTKDTSGMVSFSKNCLASPSCLADESLDDVKLCLAALVKYEDPDAFKMEVRKYKMLCQPRFGVRLDDLLIKLMNVRNES